MMSTQIQSATDDSDAVDFGLNGIRSTKYIERPGSIGHRREYPTFSASSSSSSAALSVPAIIQPKQPPPPHPPLYSNFNNTDSSSVPASTVAAALFFTKAPLGCLRQSPSVYDCEPEPSLEDSFFTPIVSKIFQRKQTSTTSWPTTTAETSPPPPWTTATTISATTKTPRTTTASTTQATTKSSSSKKGTPSPPTTASSHSSSSATPHFPIGSDDHTLYAVRPTTPMNGFVVGRGQEGASQTSLGPSTSSNQLGDDKKILIGVGSLSIVIMVGAILLCVFCKRCNQLCSQMASAAGGSGTSVQPGALKAGYTPIPPNEFASPQLGQQQHHQMQNFESNGTRTTAVGPTTSLLRNGGTTTLVGNGMATSAVGTTERRLSAAAAVTGAAQTRVVLVNGNGGGGGGNGTAVRETNTELVAGSAGMAAAIGMATASHQQQQQQRKREFKEWYV